MLGCLLVAFIYCNAGYGYSGAYAQSGQQVVVQAQQGPVYGPPYYPPAPQYAQGPPVYYQPQPYYAPPPPPIVIPWVFWNGGWGWWNNGHWHGNGWGGHWHGHR